MSLPDRLNCPACQSRLASASAAELVCSSCDRRFAVADGVADLIADRLSAVSDRYSGVAQAHGLLGADLPARIKAAAGSLWPVSLGDTIEIGCGIGAMTQPMLSLETVRNLLVVDTDPAMLLACKVRVAELPADPPVMYAAVAGELTPIRDAVADSVIGTTVLAGIRDARGFLTQVQRILKLKGHALFVVPNRRYFQAVCLAMAEAFAQRFARAGGWTEGSWPAFRLMGEIRRCLVRQEDPAPPTWPGQMHYYDADVLQDICREVGFGSIDVLALDPDPAGGQTISRLCQDAGTSEAFAQEFGPLAASVGRPYLSLLNQRDASAFSLVRLTKAAGPTVRVFTNRSAGSPMTYVGPDTAVAGTLPRWSVELLARDTPDGVVVTVGGWCIANIDALGVRVTLGSVSRQTPVWHPRPDVHEVLNRARIYHPWHALCSGLSEELLFSDVHPGPEGCPLRLEIILAGDLVVTGPAPEWLVIDQPTVIAH
jgi:SAM-dependent methyltransferase